MKLLLMINSWSSSEIQNLSHLTVTSPLTCANLNLAIKCCSPYPYPSYLWHSNLNHKIMFSLPPLTCISSSYLWHSKLSHIYVVYPPLTTGILKLAIKWCSPSPSYPWHSKHSHTNVVYPLLTCGTLSLAIQMLYILLLPVAL